MRVYAAALGLLALTGLFPAAAAGATAADLVAQGDTLKSVGEHAAAAKAYRNALEADPDFPEAHFGLGLLCLRELKDYGCAADHFRTHLELKPGMAVVGTWLVEAEEKFFRSRVKERTREIPLPPRGFLPSEFREVEIDSAEPSRGSGGEEKGERTKKEGVIEIIAFRDLRGTVTVVGEGEVTIDLGGRDGVVKGMQFAVYRGEEWAGLLRVAAVADTSSVCEPIAGKKISGGEKEKWAFEVGSEVRQRQDVLGAGMANEAEVREKILGWQKEQQGLEREQGDFKERERRIFEELGTTDSPAKKSRLLAELTDLSGEFRGWRQRFSQWVDGVLKMQEERFAGNPHLASYRRQLEDRYRIESEGALWWEVRMAKLSTIMKILASIPEFTSQEQADAFAGRFYDTVYYFEEIQGDVERWQGQDDIHLPTRRFEEEEFVERILNFARYSLLTGRDRRAARLFRSVAAKESGGSFALAAREGLEEARLKLMLKGEEPEEASTFAPPLATSWEHPCTDLQGEMKAVEGLLYAFCSSEKAGAEGSELKALALERGKPAWKFAFPGRLGGNWHVGSGEILFASDEGVLYRVDAGTGRLLGEFNPVSVRNPVSRIVRKGSVVNWIVAGAGGKSRIYSIDLLDRDHTHASVVNGDVTGVLASGNRLFISASMKKGASKGKGLDGFSSPGDLLPGIPLGKSMPLPHIAKTPPMYVAAIGGGGAMFKSWGVASGSVQWIAQAADLLVLSIVEPLEEEGESVSHICFAPLGVGSVKPWRVSLPGRDAVADMKTDGDLAYIVLRDGYLLAVDLVKESVVWKADLPVPATRDFRWSRFLPDRGGDLVIWCGHLEPPWKVYTVDRDEGVVNTETAIVNSLRSMPVFAGGHLFIAGRDGTLRARSLARESGGWSFGPRQSEGHFLPRPLGVPESMSLGGDGTVTWDDRQRFLYRDAFWSGYRGNREPLFFDGEKLVYWSGPQKLLYAFEAR